MVRVLGVNASARKYGNTFKMLALALKAAEAEGAETKMIHLYDYRIERCLACYSDRVEECYYPKKCPLNLNDDYHFVSKLILEADAVIFATPVYWFNVSAALKLLIERMTGMENMINITGRSLLDGKVAGAIAVGEEAGAAMALAWLVLTLNMMGFHVPAWATAYYHGKGNVLEDEQAVMDAYNVGRTVVKAVKLLRGSEGSWYDSEAWEKARKFVSEIEDVARRNMEKARGERTWL